MNQVCRLQVGWPQSSQVTQASRPQGPMSPRVPGLRLGHEVLALFHYTSGW
jgi:hypothetical protein